MLLITKPLVCGKCGRLLSTYMNNRNTGKYTFLCPCGNTEEVTEKEYREKTREFIRNKNN